MTKTTTVKATVATEYGSVANGFEVGSGYDVEIKRESKWTALVNVMSPNGSTDLLTYVDVEPDQDLQALARVIGRQPFAWNGGEQWADRDSDEDDGWDDLADRWNAITVIPGA